jgi:hypothetical protein
LLFCEFEVPRQRSKNAKATIVTIVQAVNASRRFTKLFWRMVAFLVEAVA